MRRFNTAGSFSGAFAGGVNFIVMHERTETIINAEATINRYFAFFLRQKTIARTTAHIKLMDIIRMGRR